MLENEGGEHLTYWPVVCMQLIVQHKKYEIRYVLCTAILARTLKQKILRGCLSYLNDCKVKMKLQRHHFIIVMLQICQYVYVPVLPMATVYNYNCYFSYSRGWSDLAYKPVENYLIMCII